MKAIGIGVIGAGYMGKAHSVAIQAAAAVFDTPLRPRMEMIATTTPAGAAEKARAFGFMRSTGDWRVLVNDPKVEAVIIAGPQAMHAEAAMMALALNKPVLCEKPLAMDLAEARLMAKAARESGTVAMAAFNYIRTPASQLAREIIMSGEIGTITCYRGEHTEDFLADAALPADWRTRGRANGCMGDLAPHPINCALTLAGPIERLTAEIDTVVQERQGPGGPERCNYDQAMITCRFASGALGSIFVSRTATGKKMGYAYEISGSKGAIRFDGEDQNSVWLYKAGQTASREGFTRILTGPHHPDYKPFCLGPGHGTGYQDQIIIEAKDFLEAIAAGASRWPSFEDGLAVHEVTEACWRSHEERRWVTLAEIQRS
jgi:predicted dehydrogenase